jgi:D-serine deaminase-like pyridoxal phosphate-dependent protein
MEHTPPAQSTPSASPQQSGTSQRARSQSSAPADPPRKARPLGMDAQTFARLLEDRPGLEELPTPLLTLSTTALEHNLYTMADWCDRAGVDLAPHGKTSMSPDLWRRQLEAGAWGITVATPWQAQVALDHDVPRVLLANELVQPAAIRALAPRADRLTVWADDVRGVEILDQALAHARSSAQLNVLVDVGGADGRTGARTTQRALEVARAIASAPTLRLAGVAGYEGALAHDSSARSLDIVRAYLQHLVALHDQLLEEALYPPTGDLILSAGGSAYFDLVAEVLGPRHDPIGMEGPVVRVLLRSGSYLIHDDGFYRMISPLARQGAQAAFPEFHAAMHAWASVLSRPEPGLVLLDAGRRDLPFDEGLPEPQAVRHLGEIEQHPLKGARVTQMNDQHLFLEVPDDAAIEVGDVVRLGLSHPCTAMDKWRTVVLVEDAHAPAPRATGQLATEFG